MIFINDREILEIFINKILEKNECYCQICWGKRKNTKVSFFENIIQ